MQNKSLFAQVTLFLLLISLFCISAVNKENAKCDVAPPIIVGTVDIYLKLGDTSISSTLISFPIDIADAGWTQFIHDYKLYFDSGIAQRTKFYIIRGTLVNGKEQFTRLSIKFTDIAFLIYQSKRTAPYTITCTANPGGAKDHYWFFYFHNSGQSKNYLAKYDGVLGTMSNDFDNNYMAGTLPGKKKYRMYTRCNQVETNVLIDWKYVKALQSFTNTAL